MTGSTHAHAPPSCHARMRKERESKPSGTKVTSGREKVAGRHPDLHGHRFPPDPKVKQAMRRFFEGVLFVPRCPRCLSGW